MQKIRLDVVGDPIDHSKSPVIHETVLDGLGLDYEYRKVRIEKGHLEEYLDEVQKNHINGFNLTMPHKQDILPYLDFIDEEALVFDAVNTVKVKDGKLYGYNTDGQGCVWTIEEKGYTIKDIKKDERNGEYIITIVNRLGEESVVIVPKGQMEEENFSKENVVYLDEDGMLEQAYDKEE